MSVFLETLVTAILLLERNWVAASLTFSMAHSSSSSTSQPTGLFPEITSQPATGESKWGGRYCLRAMPRS